MEPIYANLPGIAKGEPDIYESEDYPQFDEIYNKPEESCEDIEVMNLDAMNIINRFQTRHLDGFNPDLSNRINNGYRSSYEICTEGQIETPQQKLKRLKLEIEELSLQVKENKIEVSDPATFINDLQESQNRIETITIENRVPLIGDSISNMDLPMKPQQNNEISQVPSRTPYNDSSITAKQIERLQNLDVRLNKAEVMLGATSSNARSQITEDPSMATVKGALTTLNRRLDLLDNDSLCQLQERLQRACDLSSSSSASMAASSPGAAKSSPKSTSTATSACPLTSAPPVEIQRLYDQFEQFRGYAADLPMFLERLNSLKIVHDKAGQYSDTMSNITLTQKSISADLELEKNIYTKVTENVENNLKIIKDSCSKIEKRIKNLE